MIEFEELLINRNKCVIFKAERYVNGKNGWIGGNIPEHFLSQDVFFERYKNNYWFYITIVSPLEPLKMYSIFVPKDSNRLNENIYPKCSILLVEHALSGESDNTCFTNTNITKHEISIGKIVYNFEERYMDEDDEYPVWVANDKIIPDEDVPSFLIKFGGTPNLIQTEDYYVNALQRDSMEFLFQIDEQGYASGSIRGNYPFKFGTVYIYAKISDKTIKEPCVGYWQFS